MIAGRDVEINTLCRELRPHARDLVGAFGIPDAFLRAPDLV
ncbi:MAG: acyl-CoA dehydrogenase [Nocardioides sp.]